jgi:L-alanine-DL-glutamate epimerase-like enolase superfamily enzyme
MKLGEIVLRVVRLPLVRPYRLSYRTYTEFEPILVEVRSTDGGVGWGEGHISPGSSSETREGGWAFCREHAAKIVGKGTREAKAIVAAGMASNKVAATALLTAIEMLQGHRSLMLDKEVRLPLLAPVNSTEEAEIADEIERLLAAGFRTLKIKVGTDVHGDLKRVRAIQKAVRGRASARIDANRGYSRDDACRFGAELNPEGVELFEQPCRAEDWDANAEVARVSVVPVMLDEPICETGDIDRAATMNGVGFCKLKLKRFGGLDLLRDALSLVRARGMEPVLGDGLATEIGCWMEACIARTTITNAGEFNGFLKPRVRLFDEPLLFQSGELVLPADFAPAIDRAVLKLHEAASERFALPIASVHGASR